MAADKKKDVHELSDDFDLGGLDIEDEERESRRAPSGRVFWMFTLGLAVIVIAVLGITAYFSGILPVNGLRIGLAPDKPPLPALTETGGGAALSPGQGDTTLLPAGSITTPLPDREYEQTPVEAISSATGVSGETEAAGAERTATVAALLTQAAAALTQTTIQPDLSQTPGAVSTVPITPLTGVPTVMVTPATTALPKTGWADEVGLPMMLVLAAALILIIVFVRLMRTARSG